MVKFWPKFLAKLCKHFSNLRKTFPNFSRSRQKNLGSLKDLDGLIDEVLALDYAKSYLRMQFEIGRTATGDLNKSANKSFGPTEKVCSDGPAINSSYVNALSSFAAGSSYFVHESM